MCETPSSVRLDHVADLLSSPGENPAIRRGEEGRLSVQRPATGGAEAQKSATTRSTCDIISLMKEGSIVPRRGNVPKREVLPDPIYNSILVTRLVNSMMLDGKKGVAQKVVYGAFDIIKEKTGRDPLEVFNEAIENIMPTLEVKARRVGGATYQVPIEVRPDRRMTLGLRWLTNYSRARNEKTMKERLANELMDAAGGLGAAVKKREDTHKMAESNKAFAHYRW